MPFIRKRFALLLSASIAAASFLTIAASGPDREQPLAVAGFVMVDSRDVDQSMVEETYSARIRHDGHGADFARVAAHVAQLPALFAPGFVRIIDGNLSFGSVRAGQTVESADTITVRRHRHTRIDPDRWHWIIDARPDLVFPDAWTGRWRLTLETRDRDTGALVSQADLHVTIAPGAPVGFSLLQDFVHCRWLATDTRLDAECSAHARIGPCRVEGSATFSIDRMNDAASGGGEWNVARGSACGTDGGSSGVASITIGGTREESDADPEPLSIGVLPAFVTDPGFASLIADGLREALSDEPEDERDCGRGGWHRFGKPFFRSERDCRSFSGAQRVRGDWRQP